MLSALLWFGIVQIKWHGNSTIVSTLSTMDSIAQCEFDLHINSIEIQKPQIHQRFKF